MKFLKFILLLALSLTLFTSCSSEEVFNEETETETILDSETVNETEDSADNSNQTESRNGNSAPGPHETPTDGNPPPRPKNIVEVLVEYKPLVKETKRQRIVNDYSDFAGLISIYVCPNNPDIEIWTLNADIYYLNCEYCSGPKSAQIEEDPEVERVLVTNDCND